MLCIRVSMDWKIRRRLSEVIQCLGDVRPLAGARHRIVCGFEVARALEAGEVLDQIEGREVAGDVLEFLHDVGDRELVGEGHHGEHESHRCGGIVGIEHDHELLEECGPCAHVVPILIVACVDHGLPEVPGAGGAGETVTGRGIRHELGPTTTALDDVLDVRELRGDARHRVRRIPRCIDHLQGGFHFAEHHVPELERVIRGLETLALHRH